MPPIMESKEFKQQLHRGRYLNKKDNYPPVLTNGVGRSFSKKMLDNMIGWNGVLLVIRCIASLAI